MHVCERRMTLPILLYSIQTALYGTCLCCPLCHRLAACRNEASGLITPNFVQIGQGVAEIWPFSFFFKMAAIRHLEFLKVGNFNCPYPSDSQNASSCQILCRSVKPLRRYGRFQFFKMVAVRHLGFVIRLFGPPTKCILVVSATVQNLV